MVMTIQDFKDFYIDLDGDVKASTGDHLATFVTDTDKLNSKYLMAESVDEIKEQLKKVNPDFALDIDVFKQYSVKTDKAGDLKGIKLYMDFDNENDGIHYLILGLDISADGVQKDYYFTADRDTVNRKIAEKALKYEVQDYDTHTPVLYSIKMDKDDQVINFKTYYVTKDMAMFYNESIASVLKQFLKFS